MVVVGGVKTLESFQKSGIYVLHSLPPKVQGSLGESGEPVSSGHTKKPP